MTQDVLLVCKTVITRHFLNRDGDAGQTSDSAPVILRAKTINQSLSETWTRIVRQ
jgi:hypothetical protein